MIGNGGFDYSQLPRAKKEVVNYTWFYEDYKGSIITYAHCIRCKRTFTYPTDDPFNCCPYCMARREKLNAVNK